MILFQNTSNQFVPDLFSFDYCRFLTANTCRCVYCCRVASSACRTVTNSQLVSLNLQQANFCIAVRLPVSFRLQSCCLLLSNCFFDFASCRLLPSNCWFYFASRVCDVLPSNCWFHFAPRAAMYCHRIVGFISPPQLRSTVIKLLVLFRFQSCDVFPSNCWFHFASRAVT